MLKGFGEASSLRGLTMPSKHDFSFEQQRSDSRKPVEINVGYTEVPSSLRALLIDAEEAGVESFDSKE